MTGRLLPSALLLACATTLLVFGCSARRADDGASRLPLGVRGAWVSPLAREHPLVGRIHDAKQGTAASDEDLRAAVLAADVVLLGEQHDNADHHRLQAAVLRTMIDVGRSPAVAFEQLDLEDQPAVDGVRRERARADATTLASLLAERVEWAKSGWPPFDEYRELFEVAFAADLDIRSANLSRQAMSHVLGPAHRPGPRPRASLAPRVELSAAQRAILAAEIEESHCGYANDRMIAAMIEAQQWRDDAMAGVLAERAKTAGAVLVAGFGHARDDVGVPLYLRERAPELRLVSIGFLEVLPDVIVPSAYARVLGVDRLPFDFVVFTPRLDDEDPCEKFREGLEKMKSRQASPPAGAAVPPTAASLS